MRAQRLGVLGEQALPPLGVLTGSAVADGCGLQVGVHGHFGVDGQIALAGKLDNDVGPSAPGALRAR